MTNPPALVWFRRDLRIKDNPALHAAARSGAPLVCLFVLDNTGAFAAGGASRWWLHHSLVALQKSLSALGGTLVVMHGPASKIVPQFVDKIGAKTVFWNRRYDPDGIETDRYLKTALQGAGVSVNSFNGALIREPWETETGAGAFYRVFTPFWRAMQRLGPSRAEITAELDASFKDLAKEVNTQGTGSNPWGLLPTAPNWAAEFPDSWVPGEIGAHKALRDFVASTIDTYDTDRNRPDLERTSRLSPHLAFGEISPLQIWNAVHAQISAGNIIEKSAMTFLSEIAWREFSYNLIYHYTDIQTTPIKPNFANFPWRDDDHLFQRWTKGQTGIPIVDAGMRQLWRTGWMHNRVRMIAASFLTKNLLIDWREGERWFWDTLVDADAASNTASWQWVAGSGADAAPYFRIFNPVTQSEKFDPTGAYIRKYIPELRELPDKYIHAPWKASHAILDEAHITLDQTYPKPIVDLQTSRQRALDAYATVKSS